MNKIFLKYIYIIIVICQHSLINAMDTQPDFKTDINKLIFVTKQQTQYLENQILLIQENSPDSKEFLANFSFVINTDELKKQSAILDFYRDYLYTKFIEESLINLIQIYQSKTIKCNISDTNFK